MIAGESIMLAELADNDSRAAASPAALGLFSDVAVLPHADTFAPADTQSWARQGAAPVPAGVVGGQDAGGHHAYGHHRSIAAEAPAEPSCASLSALP